MGNKKVLIIICVIGLMIIAFYSYKRFIFNRAAQLTSEIYPVWAAQGPFSNGEESAKAMKYAHAAVRGIESANEPIFKEARKKHKDAYDANPQKWESLRQEVLSSEKGKNFEEKIELARKYAATEARIDNIVK